MTPWQKVTSFFNRISPFSSNELKDDSVSDEYVSKEDRDYYDEVIKRLEDKLVSLASNSDSQVPLVGGRSSVSEAELLGYKGVDGVIAPRDFNINDLKIIESLSIHDSHFSLAVENIVALANTEYTITFSDDYSDKQKREMIKHIEAVSSEWYGCNESEQSLDGDRFAQIAVSGACSTEAEIKKDLSGIRKVHRVSPNFIRFRWDTELGDYIPVQLTTTGANSGMYVDLNPMQYHYHALRRISPWPYATPPFISALEDMMTSKDMMVNFRSMMKRIGLLGFLTVLLKKPSPNQGEGDTAYTNRLKKYLQEAEKQVSKGFSNGYNIGFKDNHTFEIGGNTINAKGASELMEIIKKMVFSGLKQDPNLHGYNYSTTETFGKIIMEKMGRQVEQYQLIVASDKAKKFSLELMLAGFPVAKNGRNKKGNPYGIKVKFAKPINANAKEEADAAKANQEAEEIRQRLIFQRQDRNILGQDDAAKELGYKKAFGKAPVSNEQMQLKKSKKKLNRENKKLRKSLFSNLATYNYDLPLVDGKVVETFFEGFEDKELDNYYNGYVDQIKGNYDDVWNAARKTLAKDIADLPSNTSFQVFFSVVENAILRQWKPKFLDENKAVIKEYIDKSYRHFREDKSIFTLSDQKKREVFDEVPDSVFDLLDFRAIEYLERLDNIYLGKFITDEDTRMKFKAWLEELYLSDNSPIGNEDLIEQFLDEFGVLFRYEAWKIVRVISTTMNKVRNYANVLYINQANIEKFEIVEVLDSKTCAWCRHLNGKQFVTSDAVTKIEKSIDASGIDIGSVSPFATTIPIEEFTKMDAPTLQELGIDTPSYHPFCRGRVVAVI